jgi:hypothetical protein
MDKINKQKDGYKEKVAEAFSSYHFRTMNGVVDSGVSWFEIGTGTGVGCVTISPDSPDDVHNENHEYRNLSPFSYLEE